MTTVAKIVAALALISAPLVGRMVLAQDGAPAFYGAPAAAVAGPAAAPKPEAPPQPSEAPEAPPVLRTMRCDGKGKLKTPTAKLCKVRKLKSGGKGKGVK